MVVGLPLVLVFSARHYLSERTDLSELEKTAYTVVPSLVLINIVIGVYIYRVIKDPENYKRDPPVVLKPKK